MRYAHARITLYQVPLVFVVNLEIIKRLGSRSLTLFQESTPGIYYVLVSLAFYRYVLGMGRILDIFLPLSYVAWLCNHMQYSEYQQANTHTERQATCTYIYLMEHYARPKMKALVPICQFTVPSAYSRYSRRGFSRLPSISR